MFRSFNILARRAVLVLLCLLPASLFAADVTWTGASGSAWENGANWDNGTGPLAGDAALLNAGSDVDYSVSTALNYIRIIQSGGTLNVTDGELKANSAAWATSDLNGTVRQTGGLVDLNVVRLGSEPNGNGIYELSDGEFRIGRARSGNSLVLGGNGTGTLTISGGRFLTRSAMSLEDNATFSVLGSQASGIVIGGANDDTDGAWNQVAGATLNIGVDQGGSTSIFLRDNANDVQPSATFANGAILNVDYHTITEGGGTWTVMEVENGDIVDNGLAFAPGVDTSIWSFAVDNSAANGRLIVSAIGDPLGLPLTIGKTPQQRMRFGMDYERLWYWSGNLNNAERQDIARWSAVDTDIDYIRVAINGGYELTEGDLNLSAYTSKIIPMMEKMQEANPKVKFFASPRPLNEAENGVAWQPYPRWITGDPGNGNFDFDWQKCAEYLERYILLMKSYGFKISFLDITNEWQGFGASGRITTGDVRDVVEYLKANLDPADMPLIVAPSSWNYTQGRSWINDLDTTRRRNAVDIASSHNTDRSGDAASFAATARSVLGADAEIWNTEVHGWKSTSSENETTSFYYYLEAVRAGFGGLNGWLAIGTRNQGHTYILNPSGTPTRNVKYHIFQKLSATANRGHALDILQEPDVFTAPLDSNDDDIPRNVAAFIKGNLMTIWVVNETTSAKPVTITPFETTMADAPIRRTRWTDPDDVEGFVTYESANAAQTSFTSTIPGESVTCFEIVLSTEDFAPRRIEAESYSHQWGTETENSGDVDGDQNLGFIEDGDWIRHGAVALAENSTLSFRVARANGRPNSLIRVREGTSEGPILGEISVPVTGGWQSYQTIETTLENPAGIYNLYLEFVEDGSDTGNAFVNVNWFSVNKADDPIIVPVPVPGVRAFPAGPTQINVEWDAATNASSYQVEQSSAATGPFTVIATNIAVTTFADTNLTPYTEYYYVVRGQFGPDLGPSTTVVVARTESEPIGPENLNLIMHRDVDSATDTPFSITVDRTGLGQFYQLYSCDLLEQPAWAPLGPIHQGDGNLLRIELLADLWDPAATRQFFYFEVWRD